MSTIETREQIIKVARKLFSKQGIGNITMNDIAKAANKSRRTVYTYFQSKEELLEDMLWRNEKQNKSYVCRPGSARKDAKQARLIYKYIGRTERYYLVEVELLTGRHHQIRCQLSNMGSPIKGDLKYGAPRSNPDGGISLHARRITFTHPVKKEIMTIEAPVPTSWKRII